MAKTMLYRVEFYDADAADDNALFSSNPILAPLLRLVISWIPVGWIGILWRRTSITRLSPRLKLYSGKPLDMETRASARRESIANTRDGQ